MMDHDPRYQIRRAEPEDASGLHALYSFPSVVRGTLRLPYESTQLWQNRLAASQSGALTLVAVADEAIIGNISLHAYSTLSRRRHAGGLGMAVRDDWQGRGVGTAMMAAAVDLADNWLNLRRLELQVYTDNEPAIRLYRRFSFAVEGTLREYAFRDGRYVDVYAMARFHPARPPASE